MYCLQYCKFDVVKNELGERGGVTDRESASEQSKQILLHSSHMEKSNGCSIVTRLSEGLSH